MDKKLVSNPLNRIPSSEYQIHVEECAIAGIEYEDDIIDFDQN